MVISNRLMRWINKSLWLATALLFLACPLTALWFILEPHERPATQPVTRLASAEMPSPVQDFSVQSLESYAVIWQRDLRQPPIEPVVAGAQPRELPPLGAKLLGTAMETERCYAIFLNSKGLLKIRREGETLDEMTVAAIEHSRVLLTSSGREEWLELPQPELVGVVSK